MKFNLVETLLLVFVCSIISFYFGYGMGTSKVTDKKVVLIDGWEHKEYVKPDTININGKEYVK